MTEEEEKVWNDLNSYGIYTMEEFKEAVKRTKLDIKVFTAPIKKDDKK